MYTPRIAFCITCKGRSAHIKQTLPRNLADNPDALFVLLDYDSPDDLQEYLHTAHAADIESGRLVVYRHSNGGAPFHMAHAKNIAARCAMLEGADVLVTLDADNFAGPDFAQFVADSFCETDAQPDFFLCPNFKLIQSLPHGDGRPMRGYAGRLALRAQTFVKLGGYDEIYDTWRGEDIDMVCRLQRTGYHMRHIGNRFLNAVPHNSEVRFKEYPHAQQYENKREFQIINSRTQTVVNRGRFGLGTVYRHDSPEPIVLRALPTRIFGIGLHRTATTSLDAAFGLLGFDSFHWGTGEAPLIWQEMNGLGTSKTLEQWYALSDLPIPLLYKKLDLVYPGSKFILTLRQEDNWIRSVERLWDARYNPNRWMWDKWPFSNFIHSVLYGQKDFNAEIMLARYRRHNAEVRDYFRERPEDLLVMDMDAGAGWQELCTFLNVAAPAVDFPRRNPSV